jgi:uncharacterized phage protein (TIGR02218 family)
VTALLRSCSPALATALVDGSTLWVADLFKVVLVDGVTTYYWTSWDSDLTIGGQVYSSKAPWLKRSKWNITNTMEVPTMSLYLHALNGGFAGGAQIKLQIVNGLFDGATVLLSRVYMPTPGDTSTLGLIDLQGGFIGAIDQDGVEASIAVKGKTNVLDQNVPREAYQIGCNHAFCDPGCTLLRASYTTAFVAGTAPTPSLIPWSGTAPGNAANYRFGTIAFTSGPASGQRRTIQAADSSGLTLAYPLSAGPLVGDGFTAFAGCDKTSNSGSGQSCTDRSNLQNYDGYEFVPPPTAAF